MRIDQKKGNQRGEPSDKKAVPITPMKAITDKMINGIILSPANNRSLITPQPILPTVPATITTARQAPARPTEKFKSSFRKITRNEAMLICPKAISGAIKHNIRRTGFDITFNRDTFWPFSDVGDTSEDAPSSEGIGRSL